MSRMPDLPLQHRLIVEPLLGQGATGPVYGPPVTVAALVVEKRGRARDLQGRDITTSGQGMCQLDQEPVMVVGSRVRDHSGRATWLVTVDRYALDGALADLPLDHLEFTLA